MKNLFTLIFVFFLFSAHANNYYFSSVSGDDSRSAAQAQNASTPWKTLNKLNAFFSSLKPGDAVLLKRGETFYGSLAVHKSGTSASPIVIGAYGSGNKPIITSLVTLSDWVSKGNGIWESHSSYLGTTVSTVLINNSAQEMGRYPNRDAVNKGYLTLESHTIKSITDHELKSSPNWKGAELVLRTRRWVTDRCPITNHSGGTLTYTPSSGYSANNDYGYFIQNNIKTLDKFGEWYYDRSSKKLSVYFGANNPSSYIIQATSIDNLITASSSSYIVFDNLNVKGANTNGFNITNGANINIKNCDVIFSGANGFAVKYHDNLRIENCTITNSNNTGIDLGYSGDYAIIRNNKITNTSIFAGMGGNGDSKGFGIYSSGNNTLIEYNQIFNTGYVGINFNGNKTVVKNNFIDTYCVTKDDGSGIYTYTGPSNATRSGRKVIGNIILNGIGAAEGINDPNPAAEGIYLDDNSSGVEIANNSIANTPDRGIYLNNARNLIIRNNTFYNNKVQFYAHQYRKKAGAAIRNLAVKQNIFFAKNYDQRAALFTTEQNDNGSIGTLDSNYYTRPIDDRLVILNSYINSAGKRINENLDLEGWKKKYNKDGASKRSAKQIAQFKINSLTSSNKFTNGTFTTNITGVAKSSCTTVWSKSGQLDGGYLQVTPTAQSSYVYLKIGGLKAGKKYLLKYSARGVANNNMNISTRLKKDGSPYNYLTDAQSRTISIARTNNEVLLSPSSAVTAATVVFRADAQSKYYLDNIEVYEANASNTNVNDSVRFEYNATQVNKTVSLPGNFVDVRNNKYSNSIVLQPFTSAVLIKNGGTGVSNTPPSVSITSPDNKATFASPASVTVNATAADTDGSVSSVEFYNGDALLGTDTNSPYTFTWSDVAAGNYSLTAKATDNSGNVTASEIVTISVTGSSDNYPTVSLTSPTQNASYNSGATINISADASVSGGSIDKVEFYNGSTLLHTETTSPYTWDWSNVSSGSYTITAKATDNSGNQTISDSVTITVLSSESNSPTVSLTSPTKGASYNSGANINVSADASVAGGSINKVEFYNGSILLHTERSRPYAWKWLNVSTGSYTITAKATDDNGNTTTSESVTISVTGSSNNFPTVTLTSPTQNASYNSGELINISAAASVVGSSINKVEFYNGTTLLHTETGRPYTWNWKNVPAGSYVITAKAIDNNGNSTTSESVTITVAQSYPAVSLTSPTQSASYNSGATVTISADASVIGSSINRVAFYNGSALLHTETGRPYTWNWKNVKAGNYTITAKATDNRGNVTTSESVTISVNNSANRSASGNNNVISKYSSNVTNTDLASVSKQKNSGGEMSVTSTMTLFPNPAVNTIQIKIEGLQTSNQKATVTIQNLSGIMFKNIPVILPGKTIEADVSSLKSGVYMVTVVSGNSKMSKKFIKN